MCVGTRAFASEHTLAGGSPREEDDWLCAAKTFHWLSDPQEISEEALISTGIAQWIWTQRTMKPTVATHWRVAAFVAAVGVAAAILLRIRSG